MPSLLTTTNSFLILVVVLPVCFAALIYSVETTARSTFEANSFSEFLVFLHFCDQHVIQFLGRIMAGLFQLRLKCRHFDQPRQIAARSDRNNHVRNIGAEDLSVL